MASTTVAGCFKLLRIDEVGHAKFRAMASRRGLRSMPMILSAPTIWRPGLPVETDAAEGQTPRRLAPASTLGRKDDRADAGGDAAADVADLVERCVLAGSWREISGATV